MNRLSSLPKLLPPNLNVLKLGMNQLTGDLSSTDFSSSKLGEVCMNRNPLISGVPDFGKLLYSLDVSNTRTRFPDMSRYPLLVRLNLCSAGLTYVPALIGNMLSELYLSGNDIVRLDLSTSTLPSLRILRLDCNYAMTYLDVSSCESLEHLDVSFTSLTCIQGLSDGLKILEAKDTSLREKSSRASEHILGILERRFSEEEKTFRKIHCDGNLFEFGPAQKILLFRKRRNFQVLISTLVNSLRAALLGYPPPLPPLPAPPPLRHIVRAQRRWRRSPPRVFAPPQVVAPSRIIAPARVPRNGRQWKAQDSVDAFLRAQAN